MVNELSESNASISVMVKPIASHLYRSEVNITYNTNVFSSYIVDKDETDETDNPQIEDPISMGTGAFATENTLMSISGAQELSFRMSYDSIRTDEAGTLGYGWYHNYESAVEDYGSTLTVHMGAGSSMTFASEDATNHVVDGEYEDGVVYLGGKSVSDNGLDDDEPVEEREEAVFLPLSQALDGYQVSRMETGYILQFPDGSRYLYDEAGRLRDGS